MNTIAINLPRPLFFKEGWLQWTKDFPGAHTIPIPMEMNVS